MYTQYKNSSPFCQQRLWCRFSYSFRLSTAKDRCSNDEEGHCQFFIHKYSLVHTVSQWIVCCVKPKFVLSVFLIVVYILQQRVWGNFLFSTKSSINHGRVEKSCLLTFGRYSCSWVHTREEVAKGFARQSPHPGSNPDSPLAENLMFYCKSSRKEEVHSWFYCY